MRLFFQELIGSLPLVLGLLSICLVVVLLLIARRLTRAAEAAADAVSEDAARIEKANENGEVAIVDLRIPVTTRALRSSFRVALGLLRRLHSGPRSRYQVPWFLCLGPAGSGKTTLLHHTQQPLPVGRPDPNAGTAPPGLAWWIFDRNVVLDVSGDLVLDNVGTGSDQSGWLGFLRLLRRHRNARPSDGVLLTLPADDLLGFKPDHPEAPQQLADRAGVLRRKLQQVQNKLRMQLPVYLLVTKCDLVPGFVDFVGQLDSDKRRQMFGWSCPEPPETLYDPAWIDDAWQSLDEAFGRISSSSVTTAGQASEAGEGSSDGQKGSAGKGSAEKGSAEKDDRAVAVSPTFPELSVVVGEPSITPESDSGPQEPPTFPEALADLHEPLRIYMNQIFTPGVGEPFPFRGLYFCGGHGAEGDPPESVHDMPTASGWTELQVGSLPGNAHQRIDFVPDLLREKIFSEWNLARPTGAALRGARRRLWTLRALLVAGLILGPVVVWAGAWLSGTRAQALNQELLGPIFATLRPAETPSGGHASDEPPLAVASQVVASPGVTPPKVTPSGAISPVEPSPAVASSVGIPLGQGFADGSSDGELTSEQLAVRAAVAINAAGELSEYRLQTALLPWGVKADHRMLRAMNSVYHDSVFPALQYSLDQQISGLAQPGAVGPAPAEILGVDSVPEFELLVERTSRLGELELDVSRYACFTPAQCAFRKKLKPQLFRELVRSIFGHRLKYPSREAEIFYSELFRNLEVDPYSAVGHHAALEHQALVTSDAMYRRLFSENVLVRDLEDIELQVDRLTVPSTTSIEITAPYRRLLDTLKKTREDLARPEMAWVGAESLELGKSFDAWLRAVIGSELLGRETANQIRRRGEAGFRDLQKRLVDATSAVGPLLASTDGELQLELSAETLKLEQDLQTLLAARFMAPSAQLALKVDPPDGTALYWLSAPLSKAVGLVAEHQQLTNPEALTGFGPLRPRAVSDAQRALDQHLLDQIALAQDFRAVSASPTRGAKRRNLAAEVANFQSVRSDLGTVLNAFEAPPPAALAGDCAGYCSTGPAGGWCLLSAILESQQRNLLESLDQLLVAEALYTPSEGGFSWWDGSGNLALQTFGVETEDELNVYLATQQARVQGLANDFATPILDGFPTRDCWGFSVLPPHRRFQVVLSDLSDVENKIPNNAMAQLTDFITADMPTVKLAGCLDAVTPRSSCFSRATPVELQAAPPCDFFLMQRRELERGIEQQCRYLTLETAPEAWSEISRSFADRLEGKFPFTSELSEPLKQEATPADVDNFFRVYDREREAIQSFLQVFESLRPEEGKASDLPPWDPEGIRSISRFMDRMDTVRVFLEPFLTARAENPGATPMFDLQLQFRVNRDPRMGREVGANQIQQWDFVVDGQAIAPGDIDPPGRWIYGKPLWFSLTWAIDASTAPLPPKQANARLVGRQVVFEHRNAWSLVSLLRRHAAAPSDFTTAVDTDPETLVFEIPTSKEPLKPVPEPRPRIRGTVDDGVAFVPRPDPDDTVKTAAAAVDVSPDFETRVFLRVTLMTPDGEKTELPFPDFPSAVPPFPKKQKGYPR